MDITQIIADELNARPEQVDAAIKLYDDGNTVPFIARYRKEATGGLNDEQLRLMEIRLSGLRTLEERRTVILASITEQGKLTDELEEKIKAAMTMVVLEDLYLPYRPRRRSRATIAREKGLEPLAEYIRRGDGPRNPSAESGKYVNPIKEVETAMEALQGAIDILAEDIADDPGIRGPVRSFTKEHGAIVCRPKDENAESVFEGYYNFSSKVTKLVGHQVLAINRGEKEGALSVSLEAPDEQLITMIKKFVAPHHEGEFKKCMDQAAEDGYKRLMAPSVERDIRNELTQNAEDGAIKVFKKNLRQLLMQPPISGKRVLGWDPAFRTGCKLSVVDETGKVLKTTVIFPTAPQNKVNASKAVVKKLIEDYGITLISCGNGTASRESEQIIAEIIKEIPQKVEYIITNEAGASVYSASAVASKEFPKMDVGARSATSIARRVQDPLAELVKIDPRSIGVGQYQHDMNQKKLGDSLTATIEDCVNSVGVDLNTASASLLSYVSGIGMTLAHSIVAYREINGIFKSRASLLDIPKLGPKTYEQCAGFLRIRNGEEPLDGTAVHPESYEAARKLLTLLGRDLSELSAGSIKGISKSITDYAATAKELGIGEPTLRDIAAELERPCRDPREDAPAPVLRRDVLSIADLKEGMILKGTVRNVIDFGAFVDIGVHQDGLVHLSKITDNYIKHPLDVLAIGDVVNVMVIGIDEKKKRISLSMKDVK